MLPALAPLRRRLARFLAHDLAPPRESDNYPVLVFQSIRTKSPDQAEPTTRKRLSPTMALYAAEVRRLDKLFTNHTGAALHGRTAPGYTGPMYEWRSTRVLVRDGVIRALLRLRSTPQHGLNRTTHFLALNYFEAIWPADLPWPSDIPRPSEARRDL